MRIPVGVICVPTAPFLISRLVLAYFFRYNLKRKLAGVGPISQDAFDRRQAAAGPAAAVPAAGGAGGHVPSTSAAESAAKAGPAPAAITVFKCEPCRSEFRSLKTYESHARSKKHIAITAVLAAESASVASKATSAATDPSVASPPPPAPIVHAPVVLVRPVQVPSASDDAEEEEEVVPELTYAHCIFCRHVAEDLTT
jgi:hypothetical protein